MNDSTDTSSRPVRASARSSRTLYVDTTGAVVRKQRGRLVIELSTDDGRQTLRSVPALEVDTLVLVGYVHCTTPTLRFCLRQDIEVVLLSRHGKAKGRLIPPDTGKVQVRMAQYALQRDAAQRLQLGRRFVAAKLHNMARRLRRRTYERPHPDVGAALHSITRLERRLPHMKDADELNGLEGAATRAYFTAWPALILREEPTFHFERRTRRPPQDAVNALLGFTYSLLQKDMHAACLIAGLDPRLGLLHRPRPGCPAAVLDLMEAFRPLVADSVVLALINRHTVAPSQFEERDGGIYLNEAGRKHVYRAYGRRRAETVTPPGMSQSLPYYRVFEVQARRLARALTEEQPYQAFILR